MNTFGPERDDIRDVLADLRDRKPVPSPKEPKIVEHVREETKKTYVCKYCGASGRVNVHYVDEMSDEKEVCIEIECRAFIKNEKDQMEQCGHTESRYYGR